MPMPKWEDERAGLLLFRSVIRETELKRSCVPCRPMRLIQSALSCFFELSIGDIGIRLMCMYTISRDSPDNADVRTLLLRHFELMRASSPEESCHVMDPNTLLAHDVVLFAAREGKAVLGVGAIAFVEPGHGELKSMHTAAAARGRGVGRAVLEVLLGHARKTSLKRVSLETGSADMFAPARALYAAHGFKACPPFGSYAVDPLSVFMTRLI